MRTVRGLGAGERTDRCVATVPQVANALELESAHRVALFAAAGHAMPVVPEPRGAAVDSGLVEAARRLAWFALSLVSGFGSGIGYVLSLMAWGNSVVFARLWLLLTGWLPWHSPAFLDGAYRRSVLHRAGVVCRFRHARLHDHLTEA